jgi:hypothetical protein
MSAREMFEELGYELCEENKDFMRYEKPYNNIVFNKYWKDYRCFKYAHCTAGIVPVNVKIHKAITQQMKELGWI